ncbi:MAG: hypothetical protein A3J29_06145 [Acidobacteria bacterium RIFCSPLOWO2_12_FULL_67_14b]|nr:MAG: hypothetical protein A3J29_06145 [Acidobacteria bacterium RIFCSPLOWO2_12_FULL_67_14b]
MPRIGDLTERLAFQRQTVTADQARTKTWATFATIWGQLEPLTGRETFQAAAVASLVAWRARIAAQQLEAAAVSVSSITRSGTTATVTTAAAHGLATGDYARLAGATQTAYNGKFSVTVTSTTVFTVTVSGTPATPATGTITSTLLLPVQPKLRVVWTPSWDAGQAAKTLQVHAVRPLGRDWCELDLGEAA